MIKRRLKRLQKTTSQVYQKEIYSLAKSFSYAFRGIRFTIGHERNMRIHLSVAVLVLEFAWFYGLSGLSCALLLVMLALVISAELINTAIEALVNLQTQSYDPLAKVAKDVAAGAVLVLAAAAVGVAFFLFGDLERLRDTVLRIAGEPVFLAALALEIVLAVFFIFFWNRRKDLKRKRK